MSGGHRPGQVSVVTVEITDTPNTVCFSFKDPDDVAYFPVGGKFVAFFTPIAGDTDSDAPAPPSGD